MLLEPLVLELLLTQPVDFRDLRMLILASTECRAAAVAETTALRLCSDGERFLTKEDWRILVRMLRWLGTRVVELTLAQRPTCVWDLGPSVRSKRSRDSLFASSAQRRAVQKAMSRIAFTLAQPSPAALTVIAIRCPNLQALTLRDWTDGATPFGQNRLGQYVPRKQLPSWYASSKRPGGGTEPVVKALSRLPKLRYLHLEEPGFVCPFPKSQLARLHDACPLLVVSNLIFSERAVCEATHLVKLHLHGLCADDFPILATCTRLIHLMVDDVSENSGLATSVAALAQNLPSCLEVLTLREDRMPTPYLAQSSADLECFRRLPKLQRLMLPFGCEYRSPARGSPPGCTLAMCRSVPALCELYVCGMDAHFGDDAMATLFTCSPQLVALDVSYTSVTSASFEAIRTMGELPRLRVLRYLNEQFEVLSAMDKRTALPEEFLQAEEEADIASSPADELDAVYEYGLTLREVLATGYAYLRTVRDRRLCKCSITETEDERNPLAFKHPLD